MKDFRDIKIKGLKLIREDPTTFAYNRIIFTEKEWQTYLHLTRQLLDFLAEVEMNAIKQIYKEDK